MRCCPHLVIGFVNVGTKRIVNYKFILLSDYATIKNGSCAHPYFKGCISSVIMQIMIILQVCN